MNRVFIPFISIEIFGKKQKENVVQVSLSGFEHSKFLHKDLTRVSSPSVKPWGMEHPYALLVVLRKGNNSYEAYSGRGPDEGAPERQEFNSDVTC